MVKKIIFVTVFLVGGCTTPVAVPTAAKKVETKKLECKIPKTVKSGENYYCSDGKNLVFNNDNTDSEISY